jgi:neutral ceramidase
MLTGKLTAGIDERDIRCETGLMTGDGAPRATCWRTPLSIKTVVLYSGENGLAIVTLDLMGIPYDMTLRIRGEVAKQYPWLAASIVLCCSHTHVAPSSVPAMRSYAETFKEASPEMFEKERLFLEVLEKDIVASVCAAAGNRADASIGYVTLNLPWLTFNRRRLTRSFSAVSYWMGVPKNQAYGVEGPIDPEFGYFLIRGADFQPRAVLWNFAGHNSFHFDDRYSADIAYTVQKALDEKTGTHIPCLYTAGCGGDLNYYDYEIKNAEGVNFGLDKATENIASAIVASYREACTLPEVALGAASSELVMATRDISRNWWKDDIQKKLPRWDALEYQEKEIEARRREGKPAYVTEVMALRIGSWAFVALPGEVFVHFGLDIKARSPFRRTCVAAYANDYAGYIPTREAFAHGSYEAWPVLNARVGREGGYLMADKAVELMEILADNREGDAQ